MTGARGYSRESTTSATRSAFPAWRPGTRVKLLGRRMERKAVVCQALFGALFSQPLDLRRGVPRPNPQSAKPICGAAEALRRSPITELLDKRGRAVPQPAVQLCGLFELLAPLAGD